MYGKILGKHYLICFFLVLRDQVRYNRGYLPRAWRRFLLAKATREETSLGARPAATGSISESARLGSCPPPRIAAFATGNADPNAGSDTKTQAHADVAQTYADASAKPLSDSFGGGVTQRRRPEPYTNFPDKSLSRADKSGPVAPRQRDNSVG